MSLVQLGRNSRLCVIQKKMQEFFFKIIIRKFISVQKNRNKNFYNKNINFCSLN